MYDIKGSIWIEKNGTAFIGAGRIALLEGIKKYGSITEAARSMKMSYRQAWELVDSMNGQAQMPLVETSSGGVGGGGTRITKEGERMIALYTELNENFRAFNTMQGSKIKF